MLPGHATCRHLSRDRTSHERTFARWYGRDVDVVSLNQAAIIQVIPPAHEQALVLDASVVPNSGQQTYGLDRFWNGSHRRTETGLAISALAWLDLTDRCADGLRVEQPPPIDKTTSAEATRLEGYLDQWARVVSAHHLSHLRDVVTDGYDSTQKCRGGVRALGLEPIGTRRLDAKLRDLYQGPQRPGPGRPKTYDGKVNGDTLARFENVATEDDELVLSHPVLTHVPLQCHLRVGRVVDPTHHRRAVLLSTHVGIDALTLDRDDKARCHIEFLCRDAQPCTGLTDCQARSPAKRTFHCKASLTAVTLATLEARQHNGDAASVLSLASLKRRAFNQHLIERIAQHVAKGHSLEQSSPDDEELCNYGTMTETAA